MLVARGLARSRDQARELIDAGVVLVDDQPARKPAQKIDSLQLVSLTRPAEPWVGRAAHRLVRAFELWAELGLTARDRRCLDVGASTGGFTQVLLTHEPAAVVALDVGHDQLVPSLAEDPRVTDLPGRNVRHVTPQELGGPADLLVADLSFISLTLVLGKFRELMRPGADAVVLVKPQFEVGRDNLARTGVVSSSRERLRALAAVTDRAHEVGFHILDVALSPIAGGDGNTEYLLWLRAPAGADETSAPASSSPPALTESELRRILEQLSTAPKEST